MLLYRDKYKSISYYGKITEFILHFNFPEGSTIRKFLFVLSIIALVCFGLLGCSKDDGKKSKESSEAVKEGSGKIKIGLFLQILQQNA